MNYYDFITKGTKVRIESHKNDNNLTELWSEGGKLFARSEAIGTFCADYLTKKELNNLMKKLISEGKTIIINPV